MDASEQNIRRFLSRQIGQWTGLSSNGKKREIISAFSFNPGEGIAHCGTRNVDYEFRALPFEEFLEPVYFYFLRDQLSHIATEFWSFDHQECAQILRSLGSPPRSLNFTWRQQMIVDGELIYPDKGIAIGLIPDTGLIALVTVFSPCTLNVYKENYWNTNDAREF